MDSHENTNNDLAKNIPTWPAYNSILADKKLINTHCILPITQGTPTDWSNLYSAIAASAKLNVNIGQSSLTLTLTFLFPEKKLEHKHSTWLHVYKEKYIYTCMMKNIYIQKSTFDMKTNLNNNYECNKK